MLEVKNLFQSYAHKKNSEILKTNTVDNISIKFHEKGLFISLLSFTFSPIASYLLCYFLNISFKNFLSIQILQFGFINVAFILALSLLIPLIATFIPIHIYNKKPPVDSIRQL